MGSRIEGAALMGKLLPWMTRWLAFVLGLIAALAAPASLLVGADHEI